MAKIKRKQLLAMSNDELIYLYDTTIAEFLQKQFQVSHNVIQMEVQEPKLLSKIRDVIMQRMNVVNLLGEVTAPSGEPLVVREPAVDNMNQTQLAHFLSCIKPGYVYTIDGVDSHGNFNWTRAVQPSAEQVAAATNEQNFTAPAPSTPELKPAIPPDVLVELEYNAKVIMELHDEIRDLHARLTQKEQIDRYEYGLRTAKEQAAKRC